jgi:hypothetical protein
MRFFALLLATLAAFPCLGADVKVSARLDLPPVSLAVTPNGRKFVALHQDFSPTDRIAEITGENTIRTFGIDGLDAVLSIRCDSNGMLWLLDNGRRGNHPPKVIGWSSVTGQAACSIELSAPGCIPTSFVKDLAIDLEHQAIFIADPASGPDAALIVVNLNTLAARRVLKGAPCVTPEDVDVVTEGRVLSSGTEAAPPQSSPVPSPSSSPEASPSPASSPVVNSAKFRQGISSVALDAGCEWLYFGPLSGKALYRVRTRDVLDKFMEPAALVQAVERYSDKPVGEGMAIDSSGTIYVGDLAQNGIGVIGPDRQYKLLASDPNLLWPSGITIGPKGEIYVVASQWERSPKWNGGKDLSQKPFSIFQLEQ